MTQSQNTRIIIVIALAATIVDRFLKYLALSGTTAGSMNGGVRFELFQNPAIAFSIALPNIITMVMVPAVLVVFVYVIIRWIRSGDALRASLMLSMVLGAASNYLDRVQHGYVVDYVSFGRWFPVFNVSDVVIVVSLIALVYVSGERLTASRKP